VKTTTARLSVMDSNFNYWIIQWTLPVAANEPSRTWLRRWDSPPTSVFSVFLFTAMFDIVSVRRSYTVAPKPATFDEQYNFLNCCIKNKINTFGQWCSLAGFRFFKPLPPVGAGGGYMFSGRPSVRASVHASVRPSVIHVVVLCFRDISSICWRIFAKLLSLVHLGTEVNWLDFGVKRSKVKVTAWPNTSQIFMFTRYLQYLLTDFRQTFVTGASRDRDELIRIWGQKVKVLGHGMTECIPDFHVSMFGDIPET